MNKKNIILVIGLVVVAAALLAVYLFAIKKQQPSEEPGETSTYFEICKIDFEKINRITLKTQNFKGNFSLQDDKWVRDDEEVFPVKQATITNIVSILAANLNAFEKLANPAGLSEYGLENPAADLQLFDGQNLLLRLYVGNVVPTTNNHYYMKIEGDDNIYIVSENFHTYLVKERVDFLESIDFPKVSDVELMREVSITSKDGKSLHAYYDAKNPFNYANVMLFNWYFTEPLKGRVNANFQSDKWYLIMTRYTTVAYNKLVAFGISDDAKYGLDDPSKTIYVRYADTKGREDYSYTLYLGNQTEEGTYARFKGIDWVFLMDNDVVSYMTDIELFDHIYQTVFYPGVSVLDKITMQTPREEWIMQNLHSGSDTAQYSLNGVPLSQDSLNEWSGKILSLKYCGIAKDETPGEEVFRFLIEVNDTSTMSNTDIRFYEYQNGVYLVSVDGNLDFMMDTRYVDDFIAYMRSIN